MDWGIIIEIFKKAEFNTLMLSVAITGWVLCFLTSMNIYILGAAILSSVYCIIRLVAISYQKYKNKRCENLKEKEKLERDKKYEENRNIEISRMFDGLSDCDKFLLASIFLKGEEDKYDVHVLYFQKDSKEATDLYTARSISEIYKDWRGNGQACIRIRDYQERIAAIIDPYLYDLIKQHIDNNKAK